MERNQTENSNQKGSIKKKTGFDWGGFAIQMGMHVLQGACLALGGLLITSCSEALSPKEDSIDSGNIVPMKRTVNT